jgi:hypothetical protein
MRKPIRNIVIAMAALLHWLAPATAQVTVGEDVSLNLGEICRSATPAPSVTVLLPATDSVWAEMAG